MNNVKRFAIVLVLLATCLPAGVSALALPGRPESPCFVGSDGELEYPFDAEHPLDGRIGSTKAAFDALFEYTGDGPFDMYREYAIPGCNPVSVHFDESDTYVTGIDLYPPRKEQGSDPRKGADHDWTGLEAAAVAAGFVPEDGVLEAQYDQTGGSRPGYFRFDFSSETLRNNVPESAWDYVDNDPDYGWFSVIIWMTDQGGVGWISIELRVEDPPLL